MNLATRQRINRWSNVSSAPTKLALGWSLPTPIFQIIFCQNASFDNEPKEQFYLQRKFCFPEKFLRKINTLYSQRQLEGFHSKPTIRSQHPIDRLMLSSLSVRLMSSQFFFTNSHFSLVSPQRGKGSFWT